MQSHQKWIWQLPDWPAWTFDGQRIQAALAAARTSQGIVLGKAQAVGLENLQDQVRDALTQEAMTTASIEGEALDPQSVRSSIARRLGLDTHGAPPAEGQRNIEGLIDVMQDASMRTAEPLTLERMCLWHGALFPTGLSGMRRITVGALRTGAMEIVSGSMGREKLHFAAPPADTLDAQVEAFVDWFNASTPGSGTQPMDGLVRAALSHLWFETLHPFDDGNGRIGRAILQLALGQDMGQAGRVITLSRQIELQKNQYYQALERAQRSDSMDVSGWMAWMLEQIAQAGVYANTTIDTALQRIRFQASIAQVAMNERQRKVLQKLLDAGPKGFKGGMSTRKHQQICGVSTPTAARDLIEMERLGLLVRQGAGRSVRYYPAIKGWVEDEGKRPDSA